MAHQALGSLLHFLRRFHDRTVAETTTDGELLSRYVGGDEAAFAVLVRRHGPLVWGVCRRLLDNDADAEDAFQAAFLVLLRKAESLRVPQSLAAFLHGVAYRIAQKAKRTAQRRRHHEARAVAPTAGDPLATVERRELRALLDEELERLPEKYRAPLVLCYLEGKSYVETARQLGWRDGTVCGWLARARELLRQRLRRRGLTLSGAALVSSLSESSSAPAATVAATARMAALFALGETATGAVSPSVSTLAQGVLRAMSLAKLKSITVFVAFFCVLAGGGGLAAHWLWTANELPAERTETPPLAANEGKQSRKEPLTRTDRYGDPLPAGAVARLGTLRFRHEGEASSLLFSPNGKILASASNDGLIFLWDSATGKELRRINIAPAKQEMSSHVFGLAFSPDSKMLASRGMDYAICLWDVATGKELRRIATDDFGPPAKEQARLCFSSDGKTLAFQVVAGPPPKLVPRVMFLDVATGVAAGTVYQTIRLWDVATGKELFEQYQGHDAQVNAVAFSPDGKILASGGDNQQIRLWDAAAGTQLRLLKSSARTLAFSPDGKRLASLWRHNNTVRLSDAASGKEALRLTHEGVNTEKRDSLRCLAFSPDGRSVFTVDHRVTQAKPSLGTARLHIWDAANGRHIREFAMPELYPECLAVAPGGKSVAVGGANRMLQIWDVDAGKRIRSLPGHQHQIEAVAFSPDGRTLASGSLDRTVRLWEAATGKLIRTLHGHSRSVTALAFAPGGRWLASGSGAEHYPYRGRGPRTIRVWDIFTGKEVFQFRGHDSNVTSLAFAADGSRLASGLRNSSVLIWNAAPLKQLAPATKKLAAKEVERLWTELATDEAGDAYATIGRLIAAPRQTVALLNVRLQPAKAAEPQRIRKLIAELDHDEFAVREAASRELTQLGHQAEPALRRALADRPTLEMRRRIEPLLASLHSVPSAEASRQVRAVQVLEHIGTPEARQVLDRLAKGAPNARRTREVKAALQRLSSRPASR